ncbi:MAG: hypothetical protein COS49_00670 [Candidatus Portnoybacteria bacterium CG03_land_8_20_14_0_80_41_10]|uniref:DUF8128 domain-containing protein n=1 Tax=Candidatus Portnoybacteria bacterium CG03_land_8_20_14_0_80_41_10 TaxID=1974808 RepID=A0A2M7BV11_9BACT|nr:MAG: hypothetical protein COS49_00670 [Candidatus Portnoybacteria bacterium CG03_land_8_20_14_0_80_41_10]
MLMPTPLQIIFAFLTALYRIGGFLLSLWWIYCPLILFFLAKGLWLKAARQKFIQRIDWLILEIKPPAEIKKTPRAMEQFFAGLHGTQRTPNWKERNIGGEVQEWFSLEMVSQSGEIHFLIRLPKMYRDLVEAQIYAQYPETEIEQVSDYVQSVPVDMANSDYDLWGTELVLTKEDAYPIRTYTAFEKDILLEEQRIDPVASLLEVMSKLKEGENIWIQTLVRPVMSEWRKSCEKLRDKILNRAVARAPGELKKEALAWKDESRNQLHFLLAGPSSTSPAVEERKINPLDWMTKSEKDVLTALEENINKIAFEIIIRFVYSAPSDIFSKSNVSAVIGCYKQFSTENLNGFKPNKKVTPKIDYRVQLKKPRENYRKRKILAAYRKREFIQYSTAIPYLKTFFFERLPILNWFFIRSQPFVFNIEELATVYHYPGEMVKAPLTPKVEAKKGEPPMRLPVK